MYDRLAKVFPSTYVKVLSWLTLILVITALVFEKHLLLWVAAALSVLLCVYLASIGRRNGRTPSR